VGTSQNFDSEDENKRKNMESSGDHDEVLKNIDLNRIGNLENLNG
jgi:hypothetical protein